ncbi:hypothetical protein [Robiginitalea sp. SC105]|uniref:hypothetical protein n=1 Tax=Robiginitalea sp. SC105 TaxID=2762332 RepID=UPI001639A39C|nr:hypothetical protein [Robiginitalea sp. SC105]MBC2838137.1 hypothetical protein [Robiginitalea sp. SC105]
MRYGKTLKISGLVLIVLVVLVAIANPVAERALDNYLQEKLEIHDDSSKYVFDYQDLHLNLFKTRLQLTGLQVVPREAADSQGNRGGLRIGSVTVSGVGLTRLLMDDWLSVASIEIDTLTFSIYKKPPRERTGQDSSRAALDSIRLPGLREISLDHIGVNHFALLLLEPETGDTLARLSGNQASLNGLDMSRKEGVNSGRFVPDLTNLVMEMHDQEYSLVNGLYNLRYDHFTYRYGDGSVQVDNFSITPEATPEEFDRRHPYSYQIFNTRIGQVRVKGFKPDQLIRDGFINVASVAVDSFQGEVYRDRFKPYKAGRYIPMPVEAFSGMQLPMRIDSVTVHNGAMQNKIRLPESGKLLNAGMDNLHATVYNIYTGPEARNSTDSLKITASLDVMGKVPMRIEVQIPYATDGFFLQGYTPGSSALNSFNPAVYPAIGMEFRGGKLNQMDFQAYGTSRQLKGSLTMRYEDLEVAFLKRDNSKSKTISWISNLVLKRSNPNRAGRLIIGEIDMERDQQEGLANYILTAIQNGVTNSLNPVGKHRVVR